MKKTLLYTGLCLPIHSCMHLEDYSMLFSIALISTGSSCSSGNMRNVLGRCLFLHCPSSCILLPFQLGSSHQTVLAPSYLNKKISLLVHQPPMDVMGQWKPDVTNQIRNPWTILNCEGKKSQYRHLPFLSNLIHSPSEDLQV